MLNRFAPWALAIALAALTIGNAIALQGDPLGDPVGALQLTATPTATLLPTNTATLVSTATVLPTNTPTPNVTQTLLAATATSAAATATANVFLPDLIVSISDSPDPVAPGNVLTYSLRVTNAAPFSAATSAATTLTNALPVGTAINSLGVGCRLEFSTVICDVPPLAPGMVVDFTFSVIVTATSGTVITDAANVDPNNNVPEAIETNNTSTISTSVGTVEATTPPPPTATVFVTPAPTPTPVPTGQPGFRVLARTEAYSVDEMALLWVAQPGERYFILREEAGWFLAVWEGDSVAWSVWILNDSRVERISIDAAPRPAGRLWLVVFGPTSALWANEDRVAWIAQPGEWYLVILREGPWALVLYERDPPGFEVWIRTDGPVELATEDAPH